MAKATFPEDEWGVRRGTLDLPVIADLGVEEWSELPVAVGEMGCDKLEPRRVPIKTSVTFARKLWCQPSRVSDQRHSSGEKSGSI